MRYRKTQRSLCLARDGLLGYWCCMHAGMCTWCNIAAQACLFGTWLSTDRSRQHYVCGPPENQASMSAHPVLWTASLMTAEVAPSTVDTSTYPLPAERPAHTPLAPVATCMVFGGGASTTAHRISSTEMHTTQLKDGHAWYKW